MKLPTRFLLLIIFTLACARVHAEDETGSSKATTETNAPPAEAQPPKTPAPALTALVLGVGTAALILSGVDWGDDETELQSASAPTQSSPADGETITGATVTFTWKTSGDAAAYLIDIDHCDDTGSCADFRLEQTSGTTFTLSWPAEYSAGRWRIRAVDADHIAGPWSAYRNFTIVSTDE